MNFGIIGLGRIAKKFAKTINEIEGSTLYAVGSRDIIKAEEFKREFNANVAYGSYEELYEDKNIDCIYIATPNSMHYKNAMDALMHGKNVICEKPFTINPSEAKELYNYAKEHNLFIMEALWIEFLPAYKRIKEIIKNGEIGNVKEVRVSYGFSISPDRRERKFISSLGGGALLDIGIYNLALIDLILDGRPISINSCYRLNEYNTDEWSRVELIYSNAKAIMTTAIGEDLKREAYIIGDKGMICIPDFQQNQEFRVNDTIYSYPFRINGFEYQIEEAIKCINLRMTESSIYGADRSIRLSNILYDIRKSFNLKFDKLETHTR